ncbi:MAG: hypothetical protein KAT94_04565 [Candidatus Aenigmarchaeota archaeon]|nr:hypothetical protein [Candidatus Aenigmarchaeota archaeon]MCK4532119.1 hypothetical protein [Candidatus Aenigmarchaeota archaeon]
MRFDEKCRNCIFFKGNVPNDIECANNDGSIWDPGQQACDNFTKKK